MIRKRVAIQSDPSTKLGYGGLQRTAGSSFRSVPWRRYADNRSVSREAVPVPYVRTIGPIRPRGNIALWLLGIECGHWWSVARGLASGMVRQRGPLHR